MTPRPLAHFAAPEKALWRRSIVALTELGLWRDSDVDALARYVEASARARIARERIAAAAKSGADPYITKGSMGQAVVGPLIELERRARLDADHLAQQLGLTPAARKRLGVTAVVDEGDDLDAALDRALRLVPGSGHRNTNRRTR